MRRPVRKNFWANVSKSDEPDGCWLWLGRRSHGYGSLEVAPRRKKMQRMPAHRFAWTLVNGVIPNGMCVCHKCDNPPCVRPDHLFLGTVLENSMDMVAKGRNSNGNQRGSSNGYAKLTEDVVIRIRQRHAEGASCLVISREFGTSASNVHSIVTGKRWTHVAAPAAGEEGKNG